MTLVPAAPLLEVRNLDVDIPTAGGVLHAVRNVSFTLQAGEAMGIVGESGSGKSMTALALMGLLPARARRSAQALRLGGDDLIALSERDLAGRIRGKAMAMVFQEPMTSLNPVYTIGRQLTETMDSAGASRAQAAERALFLLDRVGIPDGRSRMGQYPHQLSGGQRQRVMIAMALMNAPRLIIADEPTTALDVTIQAQILRLLAELQRELGMAMILITHDLGVVSRTVEKLAVMYAGELVETGTTGEVLRSPLHPYTRGLLACIPEAGKRASGERLGSIPGIVPSLVGHLAGCGFANRCALVTAQCRSEPPAMRTPSAGRSYRCILDADTLQGAAGLYRSADVAHGQRLPAPAAREADAPVLATESASCTFTVRRSLFGGVRELRAVDDVTLDLRRGEVVALVGESGCGKSTLARMLLGLQPATGGRVLFEGRPLELTSRKARATRIQPVFQDPYSSLNPRRSIGQIIARPLDVHHVGEAADRRRRVEEMMELVGLPRRLFHSYPGQVSGGQRQRVAIARAIIMKPEILVCDEPTSALDVSVQSQILNLLQDLRRELGLTYLVITHDLGVVEHLATRVAVMYFGQIVEIGAKERIFRAPRHPYTRILLDSVLTMRPGTGVPDTAMGSASPNPLEIPTGCRFHPRCPQAIARCASERPELRAIDVRCLLVDAA